MNDEITRLRMEFIERAALRNAEAIKSIPDILDKLDKTDFANLQLILSSNDLLIRFTESVDKRVSEFMVYDKQIRN